MHPGRCIQADAFVQMHSGSGIQADAFRQMHASICIQAVAFRQMHQLSSGNWLALDADALAWYKHLGRCISSVQATDMHYLHSGRCISSVQATGLHYLHSGICIQADASAQYNQLIQMCSFISHWRWGGSLVAHEAASGQSRVQQYMQYTSCRLVIL